MTFLLNCPLAYPVQFSLIVTFQKSCVAQNNSFSQFWTVFPSFGREKQVYPSLSHFGRQKQVLDGKNPTLFLNLYATWNKVFHLYSKLRLTCFMATSPMRSECLRMFSKKSLRSDMEASLMLSRNLGMAAHMACEKRYLLTRGRYVCSNCSNVLSAG